MLIVDLPFRLLANFTQTFEPVTFAGTLTPRRLYI